MSAYLATASLVLPFTSAADLSTKKGYFVKKGASDNVVAAVAAVTDIPVGVIVQGEPVGGHNAVALPGVPGLVWVKVGGTPGTIVQGTKLQIKNDGSVIADAGTGARVIVAEAFEAGTADELIRARLLEPEAKS